MLPGNATFIPPDSDPMGTTENGDLDAWRTFDPLHPPELATPGTHILCGRAVDGAGNVAALDFDDRLDLPIPPFGDQTCRTIKVDDDAPVVTVTTSGGMAAANGWFRTGPTVRVSGYDDGDGIGQLPDFEGITMTRDGEFISRSQCSAVVFPFACLIANAGLGDGRHEVRVIATDRLGNRATDQVVEIPIDKTRPRLEVRLTPRKQTGVTAGSSTRCSWRSTPPTPPLGCHPAPSPTH